MRLQQYGCLMSPTSGPTPWHELPFYGQEVEQAPDERLASRGAVVVLLAVLVAVLVVPALAKSQARDVTAPATPVDEPVLTPVADDVDLPRAYVIGVFGPGEAVVPGVRGVRLLYASSNGMPVLVDLDTGDRRQLFIEDDWRLYEFLIEKGEIVSRGDGGHTWPVAGDRAIAVTAVRTDQSATGQPEVAICFAGRCEPPPAGEPIISGIDSIRSLDRAVDPMVAQLFDPDVWPRAGRWIEAPPVSGLDLRLPVPADDTAIWLVEQPG